MQRVYQVRLDRREGLGLGIMVHRCYDETLLIQRVTAGLVAEWNKANPDAAVKSGDRIIAVNGVRDNAEEIQKQCERADALDVTVQRARVLVDLQPCYADSGAVGELRGEGGPALSLADDVPAAKASTGCSEADEAAGMAECTEVAEGGAHPPSCRSVPQHYQGEELIHHLLAQGDVVLVRGSWLAELARCNGILPRRQDLPARAIWTPGGRKSAMEIAAVSYCWRTPAHPDPEGEQLRLLGRVAERYAKSSKSDIAVFIDWCSLYQPPRSPEEQASFMQSLCHVGLWYAHSQIWKWMLTALPQGLAAEEGGGSPKYEERGWPTFEWAASQLAGIPERVLDLGQLGAGGRRDWPGVLAACALTSREPPTSPDTFAKLLEEKDFAHMVDKAFLEATYRGMFEDLVASAEVLDFSCLGWGDEELQRLAATLPFCICVRRLYLSWNRLGDSGAEALVAVLPRCSRLCKLGLAGNPISASGKLRFRDAWSRAGKRPEQLDLW